MGKLNKEAEKFQKKWLENRKKEENSKDRKPLTEKQRAFLNVKFPETTPYDPVKGRELDLKALKIFPKGVSFIDIDDVFYTDNETVKKISKKNNRK